MINWLCGAPPARPPHPSAVKANVTEQHASVVSITGIIKHDGPSPDPTITRGVGVLIHPTLVLTTHSTIPSPLCIKDAELTFCRDVASLTYVKRKFVPEIFFETDKELDLTVVSCEVVAPKLSYSLPLDTTKLCRRALRKDHSIFIMGCQMRKPEDIVIMEGCISGVVRSEASQSNVCVRFQTAGDEIWMPGSVGFDEFGSFAFIVTKPPSKLQEDLQSPSFKMNGDEGRGISCIDRPQGSPLTARFFAAKPKHWGTCVQAIKEWVEPLWTSNRNEVFEGGTPPFTLMKQTRRPSTQGDALFKQKSFTPQNSFSADSEASPKLQASKSPEERQGEEVSFVAQQPAVLGQDQSAPASGSLPKQFESRATTIVAQLVPAISPNELAAGSLSEKEAINDKKVPPKKTSAYKKRLAKSMVFTALKQKSGLKRLSEKMPLKSKEPTMESVSVQTVIPEAEDAQPVLLLRRSSEQASSPPVSSEATRSSERRASGRDRWNLPGELDPIVMKGGRSTTGSRGPVNSGRRWSTSLSSKSGSSSVWIDNYYSLGRSRSDHSLSIPRSNTTKAQPQQKDIRSVVEECDKDYMGVPDPQLQAMQRSLSSSGSTIYAKPTISYMQRLSLAQREQAARRASQSSNMPRWS